MTGALTCRAHTVVNRPKPGAYSAVAPSKPRQVVTQSGFSSRTKPRQSQNDFHLSGVVPTLILDRHEIASMITRRWREQ